MNLSAEQHDQAVKDEAGPDQGDPNRNQGELTMNKTIATLTLECPDCGLLHDTEPCRREAADCDCCRALLAADSGPVCECCEIPVSHDEVIESLAEGRVILCNRCLYGE